jgi:hypothetical protein
VAAEKPLMDGVAAILYRQNSNGINPVGGDVRAPLHVSQQPAGVALQKTIDRERPGRPPGA